MAWRWPVLALKQGRGGMVVAAWRMRVLLSEGICGGGEVASACWGLGWGLTCGAAYWARAVGTVAGLAVGEYGSGLSVLRGSEMYAGWETCLIHGEVPTHSEGA